LTTKPQVGHLKFYCTESLLQRDETSN